MRYPRIRDIPNKVDETGNLLCRNCSKPVPKGRRNYCSKRCLLQFNRNNTWRFVRRDVLRRDNYRCSICKRRFPKRQLDIDHIIPVRMSGALFDKANLRTLCKECHRLKSNLDSWALKEDPTDDNVDEEYDKECLLEETIRIKSDKQTACRESPHPFKKQMMEDIEEKGEEHRDNT
ncbi:MAG: HNH endonuclease [Nanobdellota archaeon]